MVDDSVGWKILEYAGGLGASAASAAFAVWKLLERRFTQLEETVQQHKEDDAKELTSHAGRLDHVEHTVQVMSLQVDEARSDVVRLQAQREEQMRILQRMDENQEKILTKTDTLMETLANVLLKIGK